MHSIPSIHSLSVLSSKKETSISWQSTAWTCLNNLLVPWNKETEIWLCPTELGIWQNVSFFLKFVHVFLQLCYLSGNTDQWIIFMFFFNKWFIIVAFKEGCCGNQLPMWISLSIWTQQWRTDFIFKIRSWNGFNTLTNLTRNSKQLWVKNRKVIITLKQNQLWLKKKLWFIWLQVLKINIPKTNVNQTL